MRPTTARKTDGRARQDLRRRTRAAIAGLLVLAVPSALLVVAPLFFVLTACAYWVLGRRLESRGVLVPATVIDSSGNKARFQDAGEAWTREQSVMHQVDDEAVAGAFGLAHELTLGMGRFVPAVIAHYEFQSGGHRYRVGKYMFADERFHVDEEGRSWALVDPAHPRFNHWLVSSRRGPS